MKAITGSFKIEPKYDKACSFYEESGVAEVEIGDKTGMIDINGNTILEPIYNYIYYSSENIAMDEINGKNKFYNVVRKQFIGPEFTNDIRLNAYQNFEDGLAVIRYEGSCGILNADGNWVVEPQYISCIDRSSHIFRFEY